MRRKRAKKQVPFLDATLLAIKQVPDDIINAEKVMEKLTNKKLSPKQKASVKLKAAFKNYRNAVTRKKRADTLLEKHYKILIRLKKKYMEFLTN